MKTCSKCLKEFPDDCFAKKRLRCLGCTKEYQRSLYIKIKEKVLVKHAEYRSQNKGRIKERDKVYREKNKEKIDAYRKLYDSKNRKKLNARRRSYLFNNPEVGRQSVAHLKDSYIAATLSISVNHLRQYPELVEAKRAQLILLRATKQEHNKNNTHRKEGLFCRVKS